VRETAGSVPDGHLDLALGTVHPLHSLEQQVQVVVVAVEVVGQR
jgi:hypothetical protein